MPNQPATPARAVRVSDELWAEARAALQAGESISDLVRAGLRLELDRRRAS
jgi:Arc/MetJ-type ribon-helix-helix transcriptional regulator